MLLSLKEDINLVEEIQLRKDIIKHYYKLKSYFLAEYMLQHAQKILMEVKVW